MDLLSSASVNSSTVLHEDFTFRGSLGQEKHGHDGFAEYVDMIHNALADYRCTIEELVAEGENVFAKMTTRKPDILCIFQRKGVQSPIQI